MAHCKKLNKWFLDHASKLDLKIGKGEWISKWCPGHFDFKAEISINESTFIGRGVDSNMDIAFSKACVEAMERAVCFEHNLRSSGVAGHFDRDLAKENAKNELIERDAFLCHYLSKYPFELFKPIQNESIDYDNIINRLAKSGIEIKFLKTTSANLKISLCLAVLDNGGAIIGLAASEAVQQATEKSFFECLINTVSYLDGNSTDAISSEDFKKINNPSPYDHFRLNLSKGSSSRFDYVLSDFEEILMNCNSININYRELKSKNSLISSSPIVFMKAESVNLQSIFYGITKEDHVNLKRLQGFTGRELTFEEIEKRIHPLG